MPLRRICLFVLLLTAVTPFCAAREVGVLTSPEAARFIVAAPAPPYPARARLFRLTGNGLYRIVVRPNGKVKEVKLLKSTGHRILDDTAGETLREWRLKPRSIPHVDILIIFKQW